MARLADVTLLAAGLCVGASVGTGTDTAPFSVLQGTYLSGVEGGCELQLRSDASFVMDCRALPACTGRAVSQGREFGILCGGRPPSPHFDPHPRGKSGIVGGWVGDPEAWRRAVPPQQPPPPPTAWPPPAGDPTRGPYVSDWGGPGESFWLQPVRWGDRLYLVRSGEREAFCGAVARGVEPRTTAAGYHWLRRGDHLKRCGTRRPAFCTGARRVVE